MRERKVPPLHGVIRKPVAWQAGGLAMVPDHDAQEVEAERAAQALDREHAGATHLSARTGGLSVGQAPSLVHHVLDRPGRTLAPGERAAFESTLGHDFSGVRVHTDAQAAASAQAVGAAAYTVGEDLVFGTGRFDPRGTQGRHLLAHELAHVAQFRRGGNQSPRLHRQPVEHAHHAAPPLTERQLHQQFKQACSGVRVLERLERVERTPEQRVVHLERRVRLLPAVFKKLQEARKTSYRDELEFYKLQIWPEFGHGYAMGSLDDELARARCELARARWELRVYQRTGRLPGRLLRFGPRQTGGKP